MKIKNYTDYKKKFNKKQRRKALKHALDIRKFEIELYWKRTTYFWTLIAAIIAGFCLVQVKADKFKQDLSVILSCLGIVFSFGWICVNKGSKHWQENWETHVDMLENEFTGPLYKIVFSKAEQEQTFRDWVTGQAPMSVSKINQIISCYVFFLWIGLLVYSLFPECDFLKQKNWLYVIIGFSVITCFLLYYWGRTSTDNSKNTNEVTAILRTTTIVSKKMKKKYEFVTPTM
jgi:hypothetical protein